MPTFLVTSKMNPALRARVERAVTGRASSPITMRRMMSLARFALVFGLLFGVYEIVTTRRTEAREHGRAQRELLAQVNAHVASLDPNDLGAPARAESWIVRLASRDSFTEILSDELRAPGVLRARLASPLIWTRGPRASFAVAERVAETAATSGKDALLLCLVDPPAARSEKVLLDEIHDAYAGGPAIEDKTPNARRLHEAVVGLPFLSPPWSARVQSAQSADEVAKLRRDFERAPIERAKQAAKAGLLLVALDEPDPATQSAPTELDGERPHFVRVALVDLVAQKVLLATRRHVDPSWISVGKRSTHAMGLDSCALAFDIHESVAKK
ncbi:MAG: hypothetical protein KF819_40850 [Labilithrix sp.]|nr:hypothetical protein [Labilithrix sp.]